MNIEKEITIFLNDICVELGICDPLYYLEDILAKKHYKVNDFVRKIFEYEGLDPDLELKLFRRVKRMFIDRFGSSDVL